MQEFHLVGGFLGTDKCAGRFSRIIGWKVPSCLTLPAGAPLKGNIYPMPSRKGVYIIWGWIFFSGWFSQGVFHHFSICQKMFFREPPVVAPIFTGQVACNYGFSGALEFTGRVKFHDPNSKVGKVTSNWGNRVGSRLESSGTCQKKTSA